MKKQHIAMRIPVNLRVSLIVVEEDAASAFEVAESIITTAIRICGNECELNIDAIDPDFDQTEFVFADKVVMPDKG